MPRVPTFGLHQLTLAQTLETQRRLTDNQVQVSSGKVSPDYIGVAIDSRRLVNLENAVTEAKGFSDISSRIDTRLQMMETSVSGAVDIATRFRTLLVNATNAGDSSLLELNQRAEDFMVQLAGLLNVRDDIRHIFAGSRIEVEPIDLSILLSNAPALTNAVEYTGTATNSLTGITSLPGIVSVQVDTGNANDAFQLTYAPGTQDFTFTNLNGGASDVVNLGSALLPGEQRALEFSVGGERVVLTIDDTFNPLNPITTDTVTGVVDTSGLGVGAFGAITVTGTTGDVSTIDRNIIETTGTAANATLTLNSSNGIFVATGVDFSVGPALVPVTLTNATTGGTVSLDVNVTTGLNDAAIASNQTEIRLNNFLENVAATNGTINAKEARPDDPGYDPTKPSFYKGDTVKQTARIDSSVTVEYGITGDESGFEKLFRALYLTRTANVSPGSVDTTTLETALGLTLEALDEIPNIRTRIGSDRLVLETMRSRQDDFILFANEAASEIEDVDVAAAITRLSQEQMQLEASYTVTARLSQLTLAQFLR